MKYLLPLLLLGCSAATEPEETPWVVDIQADVDAPERLSAFGAMRVVDGEILYNEDVHAYDLTTPLFSDYALKDRALYIPPGTTTEWNGDEVFELPIGSALFKSFLYPRDMSSPDQDVRIIETRVMIRDTEGWSTLPYVWDADGTDAVLKRGGQVLDMAFTDRDGVEQSFSYIVPQKNQCLDCHEVLEGDERVTVPIGVRARYLDRDGQLEAWIDAGLLGANPGTVAPAATLDDVEGVDIADLTPAEIERTARDYLDINCAHCHKPNAVEGETSRLWLNHDQTDPFHLGVCKRPGSAGKGGLNRTYDIVPGDHEASILHYRMVTEDLGAMMPEFGRSLVHAEGARLVAAWIDQMQGECGE